MTATTQIDPIVFAPSIYQRDGQISVASNTTLTVQAGAFRDQGNSIDINLGNYNTATAATTTINTAVVGVNGIDTGVLQASKVYAVFVIADAAGYNSPACLLSLSATAPVMPSGRFPSGYSVWRRIGWAVTDASVHFLPLYQSGADSMRIYTYDTVQATAVTAGTSATYANVSLAASVPAIDNMPVVLWPVFTPNAANDKLFIVPGGSTATSIATLNAQVAAVPMSPQVPGLSKLVSGVPNVTYKLSTASAALALSVVGFTDFI